MRVQLATGDQGGCRFYRMSLPQQALKGELDVFEDIEIHSIRDPSTRAIKDAIPADEGVDVVVVQRPTHLGILESIPYLQARGIAVVVEMDDDLSTIDRDNAAWHSLHPSVSPYENYVNALKAARLADWVTVSTPRLAEVYGAHGRVSVVRNYVSDAWLDIDVPMGLPRHVGWTGNIATHPHDLNVAGSAVADAAAEARARGYLIGGPEGMGPLGFTEETCTTADWVPVEDYPREIAKLDVGIVPLANTRFNESKSWLKGLEYAAMGVPFVATPTPEYACLAGMLPGCATARKYRQWRNELVRLLSSDDLPAISAELRATVRDQFTIRSHAHEYAEAWERALRRRRSIVPERAMWPMYLPPVERRDLSTVGFQRR